MLVGIWSKFFNKQVMVDSNLSVWVDKCAEQAAEIERLKARLVDVKIWTLKQDDTVCGKPVVERHIAEIVQGGDGIVPTKNWGMVMFNRILVAGAFICVVGLSMSGAWWLKGITEAWKMEQARERLKIEMQQQRSPKGNSLLARRIEWDI